jgi:apolipoprotein N-acyltransferase
MKKFLLAILVSFTSGIAFYFSAGFHDLWWLMWIAPIPVLIYAYHESLLKTLWVAFIAGLAVGLNDIVGYWPTFIPASNFIFSAIAQSITWTSIILLSRFFMRRIPSALTIFAYPTCLALVEWGQSLTSAGTFGSFAYSQLQILPVIQTASLTGFFGVSFILGIFASSIAYALIFWQAKRKVLSSLVLGLFIVLSFIGYGYYRLETFKALTPKAETKIGLVSLSFAPRKTLNPAFASEIVSAYQPLLNTLTQQNVELILFPEEAFAVTQETKPQYQALFSRFSREYHVYLIVGVHENLKSIMFNSAWVFDQNGNSVGEYHKRHFVPATEEGFTAGKHLLPFHILQQKTGVGICRDMDYPKPARGYSTLGTQILFVPAWDFDVDAKVHASGAWMRGIEYGYTLVRAARGGYLSVSLPTGEIIAKADATGENKATLIAIAPIYENQSFYAKHPWWFVEILWAILIILVMFSISASKEIHGTVIL